MEDLLITSMTGQDPDVFQNIVDLESADREVIRLIKEIKELKVKKIQITLNDHMNPSAVTDITETVPQWESTLNKYFNSYQNQQTKLVKLAEIKQTYEEKLSKASKPADIKVLKDNITKVANDMHVEEIYLKGLNEDIAQIQKQAGNEIDTLNHDQYLLPLIQQYIKQIRNAQTTIPAPLPYTPPVFNFTSTPPPSSVTTVTAAGGN